MMLEVYDAMVAKGMLPDDQAYPKDVAAFKHLLEA